MAATGGTVFFVPVQHVDSFTVTAIMDVHHKRNSFLLGDKSLCPDKHIVPFRQKYTTKKRLQFSTTGKLAGGNQWRNSIRRKKQEVPKSGSPWDKKTERAYQNRKKAQRAERIPERKKSNWDDGEFLDDWDEVSGKTAAAQQ